MPTAARCVLRLSGEVASVGAFLGDGHERMRFASVFALPARHAAIATVGVL